MDQFRRYYCYTPPQNVSGAPAISLPLASRADGLPIGLQFAAAFGEDRLLLELALELEQARPWPLLAADSTASVEATPYPASTP
jgi:amidase